MDNCLKLLDHLMSPHFPNISFTHMYTWRMYTYILQISLNCLLDHDIILFDLTFTTIDVSSSPNINIQYPNRSVNRILFVEIRFIFWRLGQNEKTQLFFVFHTTRLGYNCSVIVEIQKLQEAWNSKLIYKVQPFLVALVIVSIYKE